MKFLTTAQSVKKHIKFFMLFGAAFSLISGCGGGSDESSNTNTDPDVVAIDEQLQISLDAANTDTDFTLIVESNNGTQFIYRMYTRR